MTALLILVAASALVVTGQEPDLLAGVECDLTDPVGYLVPDPARCNRYLDCDPAAGRRVRLCPHGTGLDLATGRCARGVHCGDRRTGDGGRQGVVEARKPKEARSGLIGSFEELECAATPQGYVVPDPEQCDRYAECDSEGSKRVLLCPDGLVLDPEQGKCDYPAKVDCGARGRLQEGRGEGLCRRRNGNFALPAEVSCSDYVDCREGRQFVQSCGAGAVFDEVLGCVHPDETQREGCTAKDRYGVDCPLPGQGGRFRFGDHDRVPHPRGDCSLFFACLRNGQPRLLSCAKPTVFNPETGVCDQQANVAGCEDTYLEEEAGPLGAEERELLVEEVRRKLLQELGLASR